MYEVVLANNAQKEFASLDGATVERIKAKLRILRENPFDRTHSKPLVNKGESRSSRVGDWRIIFTVDTKQKRITVAAIRTRGDVYKRS